MNITISNIYVGNYFKKNMWLIFKSGIIGDICKSGNLCAFITDIYSQLLHTFITVVSVTVNIDIVRRKAKNPQNDLEFVLWIIKNSFTSVAKQRMYKHNQLNNTYSFFCQIDYNSVFQSTCSQVVVNS